MKAQPTGCWARLSASGPYPPAEFTANLAGLWRRPRQLVNGRGRHVEPHQPSETTASRQRGAEMRRKSITWVVLAIGPGVVAAARHGARRALRGEPVRARPHRPLRAHSPGCDVNSFDPDTACWDVTLAGAFTSGAPFCGSGTAEDVGGSRRPGVALRRYTCRWQRHLDDVDVEPTGRLQSGFTGRLGDRRGSGRYEGLRGNLHRRTAGRGPPPSRSRTRWCFGRERRASRMRTQLHRASPSRARARASCAALPVSRRTGSESPFLRDDVEGNPSHTS